MADERKDLPPANSPNFLEKVREAVQVYMGNRGNKLDRGLTVRDLADAGLIDIAAGYLSGKGKVPPVKGIGAAVESAYTTDLTPAPTPSGFMAVAAISNILVECSAPIYGAGNGHAKSRLYGATWTTGALPVFANAVLLTEFNGNVASYATNPATTWHLWLTWVTVDGVESTSPAGGTNGVVARTGEDVALLLDALAGEITSSELAQSLNTRIDLIDGPSTMVGSIAATALTAATATQAEADARIEAVSLESIARTAQVQDAAYSALTATLAAEDAYLNATTTVSLARTELTQYVDDGVSAEAAQRTILAAKLDTDIGTTVSLIAEESATRADAVSAEANARAQLAVLILGADGTATTSGMLYESDSVRATADNALSERITLLSAGSGEQFDSAQIWYFDTDVDGWTGNGTPTVLQSFLRPANAATGASVTSPTTAVDGSKYKQLRLRIKKTGSPTFAGFIDWRAGTDSTWDTATRRVSLGSEPDYLDGCAVVTVTASWSSTVTMIRVILSDAQTATDYFEIDWVAVGRPSPGASSAQLAELSTATVDLANSTSLASKLTTLTSTVGDVDSGLVKSLATVVSDYTTSTALDSAVSTGQTALISHMGPSRIFRQITAPTQEANYEAITLKDGSATYLPKLTVGSTWYDTSDGNKPYTWSGTAWVYTPDTSTAATDAYIDNLESAIATPTTATTTAWRDAVAEVTDPVTGLGVTRAAINTLSETYASDTAASAADSKTLFVQGQEDGYTQLRNTLSGVDGKTALSDTVALARQELTAVIEDGISAEATARTALAAVVNENQALLEVNYYTKTDADGAIAQATTTLKSEMEGVDGSVGVLGATLVNDYYTKVSVDGAISSSTSSLRAYSDIGIKTFNQATAPTIRGVDITVDPAVDVPLVAGDIWIDNDNAHWQWSGTVWEALRDAAISDVDARVDTVETARIGYSKLISSGSPFDNGGLITNKTEMDAYNALNGNPLVWVVGLPMAQAIKQLTITANGVTGTIENRIDAVATESGSMHLEQKVRIGSDGSVVGYGISGDVTSGGVVTESAFIANVDKFAVTTPQTSIPLWASGAYTANQIVRISGADSKTLVCKQSGTTAATAPVVSTAPIGTVITDGAVKWQVASRVPFSVLSVPTTINGASVPAGVYVDAAYILNATIQGAQIAELAVDDTHIAELNVGKLTAGTLTSGEWMQSSNYIAGTQGWRINSDAEGTAEFGNAVVRGGVYATYGQIGGITIASNAVSAGQTAYNTGSGFYLGSDGTLSLGDSTGNRLTWDGTNIDIVSPELTLSAGSASFSGDITSEATISAPSGTLGTITSGRLQNAANTNYVNLAASGTQTFLNVGSNVIIDADGNSTFNGVVLSRNMVVASGDTYIGAIGWNIGNSESGTYLIDTGIAIPSWTGGSNPYVAQAGTFGAWASADNNFTNDYWGVTCEILPWTRWSGTPTIFLAVTVHTRSMYTSNAGIRWKVYYVT